MKECPPRSPRLRGELSSCGKCERALSLVEVLVVLGVLAVLVGALVPALSAARGTGISGRCASNLRQLSAAAHVYAAIYDRFPAALRYEPGEGSLRVIAWDWETTLAGVLLGPGPLWGFTDDPGGVQQCPAYHGGTNFADPATGYNYNTSFVGGEGAFPLTGWTHVRPGVRASACRRSASCALFGDGAVSAGVANKFMRAPSNGVEGNLEIVYAGAQAFRHGRATNAAFLDGHVAACDRPQRGTHATEALLELMGFPAGGFLSEDDSAYDPR